MDRSRKHRIYKERRQELPPGWIGACGVCGQLLFWPNWKGAQALLRAHVQLRHERRS